MLSIFLIIDFIHTVNRLHNDGQDDIKEEEGTDHDEADREYNCQPGDIRIHQVVHDFCPAFQRDELEHND